MSVAVPASLARQVVARANNVCEYCKLRQSSQEATFHIDHIHPRADGGETAEGNTRTAPSYREEVRYTRHQDSHCSAHPHFTREL